MRRERGTGKVQVAACARNVGDQLLLLAFRKRAKDMGLSVQQLLLRVIALYIEGTK